MVDPYGDYGTGGGTSGIYTYYDTDCADTTTLGSSYKTYGSGATTSASIIKDYGDFANKAATINWKVKSGYGTVTGEDWEDLTRRAYKLNCGTTTASTWGYEDNNWIECREVKWNQPIASPQMRLREMIRSRQAPMVITSRRTPMPVVTDVRETRARETLLRVLGEDKFKRFLKHGFVSVTAKSRLVYQIFPGHGITNVFQDGEQVERLCVVLKGNFPPTDSLIMRYLLILNDERDFRKHAITHRLLPKTDQALITNPESLNDVWNKLRVAA
jgi:hypothetical protein